MTTKTGNNLTAGELYERAVAYILRLPKTEKQVRQWYARKTTDQALIDEQIARLQEYNLLNDVDYAQMYVAGKRDKMGVGMIKTKLRQNGVAPAIITAAVAVIDDQRDLAVNLVTKYLRNKERTPAVKSKLFRWLLSKGIDYDLGAEVIDEYWYWYCWLRTLRGYCIEQNLCSQWTGVY